RLPRPTRRPPPSPLFPYTTLFRSAMQVGFVTPEGTFNLRVPVMVIVISVLGGRRHWAGPMVGALYVTLLQNRLQAGNLEGWSLIILGLVLAALVLLAPDGLMARFKIGRAHV